MAHHCDYYDSDNYDPQDERCGTCPKCDGDVFWPDSQHPVYLTHGLPEDSETVADCPYCDERVVFIPYPEA